MNHDPSKPASNPIPVGPEGDLASRDRMVEAATHIFVKEGYKGTSMKAIADAVNVSPPALYWHFKSKQDLFLAAMESLLDQFVDNVDEHITASEPGAQLEQFVHAHVMWKLEQSEAAGTYTTSVGMRDLVHALPQPHRAALIERQRRHLATLRKILERGVRSGVFTISDARVASFAILSVCEYVQSWFDPDGELSPSDVAGYYVELVNGMVHRA